MKKILVCFSVLLFSSHFVWTQEVGNNYNVGIGVGFSNFEGTNNCIGEGEDNNTSDFFNDFHFVLVYGGISHSGLFESEFSKYWCISKRMHFGCGFVMSECGDNESFNKQIPFDTLNYSFLRIGLSFKSKYDLTKENSLVNCYMGFDIRVLWQQMTIGYNDFRGGRWIDDFDGGNYYSTSHSLYSEMLYQQWNYPFVVNIGMSFRLSYKWLFLEFSVKSDLGTSVRKCFRETPVELKSDWEDFETYYGKPCLNLFQESPMLSALAQNKLFQLMQFQIIVGFNLK